MAEKLSWVFEGVDKFTGPMGAMSSSIVKFAFGINEAKELLESFAEAIEFVGEKTYDFGKEAIQALAFKESSMAALEAVLGTKEAAHEIFEKAESFANVTPFNSQEILSAWTKLKGDFSTEEVPIVWQAVADIGSFQTTAEGVRSVTSNMTENIIHLMAQPTAMFRSMKSLFESSGNIVNPTNFGKALGETLGTTPVKAMAQLQAGTVQSKDAVVALIRTMKELGGGDVGNSALKASDRIIGLQMSVSKLTESLFMQMGGKEPASIQGVASYKSALGNLISYFNTANDSGKRVSKALENMFGPALQAIFGSFSGPDGALRIKNVMEKVLGFIESADWGKTFGAIVQTLMTTGKVLYAVFKGFGEVMLPILKGVGKLFGSANEGDSLTKVLETLGEVLGIVAGVALVVAGVFALLASPIAILVAGVVAWIAVWNELQDIDWAYIPEQIGDMFKAIGDWFSGMWTSFKGWGASILEGIAEGITGAAGAALKAVEDVATGLMTSFKDTLGIHSPSTVFEGFGANTTEGYVQGIEGGMGDVSNAFSGLLGPGGGGSPGGSGNTVTVTFGEGAFQIEGGPNFDAETFASKLQELLPSALAPAFERMAMQTGGA